MAAPRRLYLEGLRVGDELPTLVKEAIDRVQLAKFAGVTGEYSPMHVDEVQARAAGMPSVYAPALLPMGFMAQFLTDWLRGGTLHRFAVRFVKLVWPGDVLSCKGRVLSRRRDDSGRYFVEIDLWAENQKGELVLKGHATGQIFYSAEDEARQRAGEAPLMVDVSEHTELPRNSKGKPIKARVQASNDPPAAVVSLKKPVKPESRTGAPRTKAAGKARR
jgi:acyl dehydratase